MDLVEQFAALETEMKTLFEDTYGTNTRGLFVANGATTCSVREINVAGAELIATYCPISSPPI